MAVFNRTGAPVDPAVIQAMLAASPHRAIDGQDCWISGPVALAHQHFWVTPEEVGEKQPLVADGLASSRLRPAASRKRAPKCGECSLAEECDFSGAGG